MNERIRLNAINGKRESSSPWQNMKCSYQRLKQFYQCCDIQAKWWRWSTVAVNEFLGSGNRVLSMSKMRCESSSWTPATRAFIGSLHLTYSSLSQGANQQCLSGRSLQTLWTASPFPRLNLKQSKKSHQMKAAEDTNRRRHHSIHYLWYPQLIQHQFPCCID